MRLHWLERCTWFASTLAVLGVAALVVALSLLPPPTSGIPDVAVEAELATLDWLDAERRARHGDAYVAEALLPEAVVQRDDGRRPSARPSAGVAPTPRADDLRDPAPTDYLRDPARESPGQTVEGFPWLVRRPGLTYHRPGRVPRILYDKLQSLEDGLEVAQQGGGEFVQTPAGDAAYQVNWLDPNSLLARRLGLRAGDRILSVNGHPVGASLAAGQQLHALLKTETRFAVLVEREGRRELLSFYVD